MARFRPLLIRIFAILLFAQSGVAAAHCLRGMSAGEGMLVEICSTDGMRTIRLDENGEPVPEQAPQAAGAFCPVCNGLPNIILPEPPLLTGPAWTGEAIAWHSAGTPRLNPPARAPPYATRAPPVTA